MKRSLFDTHCDTAYKLYHRGVGLDSNDCCHISLEKAACYEFYAQFYAVWCNKRLDDETCWQEFLNITDYFKTELMRLSDRVTQVTCSSELETALREGKHAAILAVEDARLTAGKLERLDELWARGVRYLTLLWGGDTCIGGSHDTPNGLTEYGKALVRGCFERGIIPDVSHASERSVDDLLPIAYEYRKPFIASHSNAHAVYGLTRNLRDRHFEAVKDMGGIVGINLCATHLADTSLRSATVEDIFAHVEHYLALGGEDTVGFGADWDGAGLPEGIDNVGDLTQVAEFMARHNYSDELIEKLFCKNTYQFVMKNL